MRLLCATCRQTVANLEMNLIKGSYLALQSGLRIYIVGRVPPENAKYKSTTVTNYKVIISECKKHPNLLHTGIILNDISLPRVVSYLDRYL